MGKKKVAGYQVGDVVRITGVAMLHGRIPQRREDRIMEVIGVNGSVLEFKAPSKTQFFDTSLGSNACAKLSDAEAKAWKEAQR